MSFKNNCAPEMKEKILSILRESPKSVPEIKKQFPDEVSISQIIKCLLELRRIGLVKAVKDEFFDETRPLTTTLWAVNEDKDLMQKFISSPDVSIILSGALKEDLGKSFESFPSFFDAIGEIILSAERELNIAVPYIDSTFTGLLSNYKAFIRNIPNLRILTEFKKENIGSLQRLKNSLFPNLEYKVIGQYGLIKYGQKTIYTKIRGIHLKMIITENMAMIGSFNMTEVHFLSNYDIAVLFKGEIVNQLLRLFQQIWNLAKQPSVSIHAG
ncbi:hypothetical protein N186_03690 [Thermofilum adornatum]|uniref:Phospholipase D-like domain-containing protein n=1 Tax=Thermofilum adornatum TaxID=1365176 RepID=S5Z713_9CREN|nr:phospholipase D-like domain-containing protein [Thermofilum adornatum]AGT35100.1 hypothetical protein N186_03690 [Thermofilum adornatum]